ncbi:MAG: excinuclease ABC subunit UvrC [Rickettsiales bacterium]|nr:excinuclease ABC subunit UvrC [Rickettsiales bacterium]
MDDNAPVGADYIRHLVKTLPSSPGVYRMLDEGGQVLYVGKAKNLRNRVQNYVNASGLSSRIMKMVWLTRQMEIVQTASEAEALLLEANLIKTLLPRYNILLRDDKSYPFIRLSHHIYPRIVKHRGAQDKKEIYFGPFASAGAVNQTLAILHRAFLLRPCADTVFKNRTRPCLQYQIKRCSAPCVAKVSVVEYAQQVEDATRFLSGKSREVQDALLARMQAYSEAEEFEKAAALRDRIRALTQVQQEQALQVDGLVDADVIALHLEGGMCCIQIFFFRGGQNFGNRSFFPLIKPDNQPDEIVETFIGQFYQSHPAPHEILLSHAVPDPLMLSEALSLTTRYQVKLSQPMRGPRRQAVEQALKNAQMALHLHQAERASQNKLLALCAEAFALTEPPRRIEVYDNSHISGTHAVGAMIVAGPEGFEKSHYRRFTMRNSELTPGDDYAMMREVLTRRLGRLQQEDPDRTQGMWPDFLLIDGGAGHLHIVTEVMEELGISDLSVACIAKGPDRNAGREQFFMPGRAPFQLPPEAPVLHYIQRLRDEAHRFAIHSHRMKRAKAMVNSPLDAIGGIGPSRKRALLHHFGSAKGVESATLESLENVPGVNRAVAKRIYDHFHS